MKLSVKRAFLLVSEKCLPVTFRLSGLSGGRRIQIGLAILLLAVLFTSSSLFAEEQPGKWKDQAEVSLVKTGGNTNDTTFSLKNELKYSFSKKATGLWKMGVLYEKSDGEKTAEEYQTELRFDYLQTELLYYYGNAGWQKNKFAGLDGRYFLGAGAGYKFLIGAKHNLAAEAGLAYTVDDNTNNTRLTHMDGRIFAKYTYNFTRKNFFLQSGEYLQDAGRAYNFKVFTETAVIAALTDILSLKAGYVVKFTNRPVPDSVKKTDTILSMTLVANF